MCVWRERERERIERIIMARKKIKYKRREYLKRKEEKKEDIEEKDV